MADREIKWQAPEFEERPKGMSWYWLSIALAVLMVALAVWQKNFLFGFFVVVAEILILMWSNKEADLVHFSIDERGVAIGDRKKHLYTELENFSVGDAEKEWPDIFFQFKNRLKPVLKIKIPKNMVEEIRGALQDQMREEEHRRSLLDTLEEFLGF